MPDLSVLIPDYRNMTIKHLSSNSCYTMGNNYICKAVSTKCMLSHNLYAIGNSHDDALIPRKCPISNSRYTILQTLLG